MGRDHTSIHQPQYCLYAQDWTVTNTERIELRMERPLPYDIPAIKLSATHALADGRPAPRHLCLLVCFRGQDHGGRRLAAVVHGKTVLQKGVTERWAYISYFTTCLPGQESDRFRELQKFIKETVPEFQTVTGEPIGSAASGKAENDRGGAGTFPASPARAIRRWRSIT